ncbi:hypothetical protein Desaci_1482 [Desulfosporosinus acidiphilus SJ4]|uniref:Uncharacterized protein n=1 Tax=Desulfosporosinus acidiphilus (strain DSM 22704 / JCM 16185 / SJ4) TaxID=646529 RepID=I4D3X2_DESAJ|nr:hypothetical protein Desaci_1482 [Desulfosporosinus acidiphilus SJ4]
MGDDDLDSCNFNRPKGILKEIKDIIKLNQASFRLHLNFHILNSNQIQYCNLQMILYSLITNF